MAGATAYLDHNASAPLCEAARAAMTAALASDGNPSSVHGAGRARRALVEEARRDVAKLVGAAPSRIVFTSGATEAAATLLTPDYRMGRSALRMSRLYVLATDHPSILAGGRFDPAHVSVIGVDANGIADLAQLKHALEGHDIETGLPLVAVHAVNNETGVIQPLGAIAEIVSQAGGLLVVDAVQAAGRIPIDIANGYGDFLILSAHKIGGPAGVGALVAKSDLIMPAPLIRGGGQEKGHRAGTENTIGIAGFGAAARQAADNLTVMPRLASLRDRMEREIAAFAPDTVFHGSAAPRVANTGFFTISGVKAETAQIALDLAGVMVSAGSACSSGKVGPSHVLAAMGAATPFGALRVSLGASTTEAEIDRLLVELKKIAARRSGAQAAA